MRILNSAQMREADRRCTGDIGIASIVLMENAGRQVVAAMEAMFSDLALRKIVVLCGRGNNGGMGSSSRARWRSGASTCRSFSSGRPTR